MTFRVGQKVTLTSKRPFKNMSDEERSPVFGEVYTIRDMEPWYGEVGLVFEEIRNPEIYRSGIRECTFNASRFRPIVEDRKSVSFTIGADPESENWDNRKKVREKV
jgi:hypothetical protein